MTQPWSEIVARYQNCKTRNRSIRGLETLARQISESALATGLFADTSMFDLRITQIPVSYPYDGPVLQVSSFDEHHLEFRYLDTFNKDDQWYRIVDADQALPRLISLRWFPSDVLQSVSDTYAEAQS